MRSTFKYQSSVMVVLGIIACTIFFTHCITKDKDENKTAAAVVDQYSLYAGSKACVSCHKDISEKHHYTAHYLSSQYADSASIKGSFKQGQNAFVYSGRSMVEMQSGANGFYQVAFIDGAEKKRERFDIVVGSGTKGQSYLSWSGDKLVQLPVTYFTSANQWSNSPGYPNKIAFDRPITSRCLECHSTFVEKTSAAAVEPETFNKQHVLLGVDCETCHGPAAKHVDYQTKHPQDTKAAYIINPATFTRRQSLDMCALCHGGRLQKTSPSFSFKAGDKLSDFFAIDSVSPDARSIDVHGNQYGLLAASKCFRKSDTLTCITCHNTHENEKGKTALFSQRCTGCHNNTHNNIVLCKMAESLGSSINDQCTNCHMPEQQSMAIAVLLQGNAVPTPALMHTHLIKAYPDATQKVIAYINKKGH